MRRSRWTTLFLSTSLLGACVATPLEGTETGTESSGADASSSGADADGGDGDSSWEASSEDGGDGDATTGDATTGDATTGDTTGGDGDSGGDGDTGGDATSGGDGDTGGDGDSGGDGDTGETTGGDGDESNCCVPHDEPTCDQADVVACVCQFDDFCCQGTWDGQCVAVATNQCGLACAGGGGGGTDLPDGSPCQADEQCASGYCYVVFDGGPGGGFEPTCQSECIEAGGGGFQQGQFCDSDADCCGGSSCSPQDGSCSG